MRILVTGSSGFIGKRVCSGLLTEGHQILGVDVKNVLPFLDENPNYTHLQIDLLTESLTQVCEIWDEPADIAIHLAALIKVGESETNPYMYYKHNVFATTKLLEEMHQIGIHRLIFASTAAVYGGKNGDNPVVESQAGHPESVYGTTKWICEQIIAEYVRVRGFSAVIFRFFNVAGAPEEGDPTHLIPIILNKVTSHQDFTIFGEDYDTRDGTCVRDYIHVQDLVSAHKLALPWLMEHNNKTLILNLGTSSGFTVSEVIDECFHVVGSITKVNIGDRRPGDPGVLVADSTKALQVLGWKPEYGLTAMIADSIHHQ